MTKEFECMRRDEGDGDRDIKYIVADDAETALKEYLGIGDDDVIKYFDTADGDVEIVDHDDQGDGNYAVAFGAYEANAVLYIGHGTKTTWKEFSWSRKEFRCAYEGPDTGLYREGDPGVKYIVADDAETALKEYLGIGDDDVTEYFSTADGDVKIEDYDEQEDGNFAAALDVDGCGVAHAVLHTGPGSKTTEKKFVCYNYIGWPADNHCIVAENATAALKKYFEYCEYYFGAEQAEGWEIVEDEKDNGNYAEVLGYDEEVVVDCQLCSPYR